MVGESLPYSYVYFTSAHKSFRWTHNFTGLTLGTSSFLYKVSTNFYCLRLLSSISPTHLSQQLSVWPAVCNMEGELKKGCWALGHGVFSVLIYNDVNHFIRLGHIIWTATKTGSGTAGANTLFLRSRLLLVSLSPSSSLMLLTLKCSTTNFLMSCSPSSMESIL